MSLVLEVGRPPEAPSLSWGPGVGESLADSVDTAASVRLGVKERKDVLGKELTGYPLKAPKARAILRKLARNGNETGR